MKMGRTRLAGSLLLVVALVAGLITFATSGSDAAPRLALIHASTVSGDPSQEEQIATALGFEVSVVDDTAWTAMTAADFGQYDLLIVGDPFCSSLPPGLATSAPVFGPVVLGTAGGRTAPGNRIVVGTDPVLHDGGDFTSPDARGTIIREGIAYAGSHVGRTGMYFTTSCAGAQSADILTILGALSTGTGEWTHDAAPPCGGNVSLIAAHPSFTDLSTASLQGWGCSVHDAYPTFPSDWSALAVATDTASTPTCGIDPDTNLNACGEAYILIAGSAIVVESQVISIAPLENTSPAGGTHTVTANVHAAGGSPPIAGQHVEFTITGANEGATGTCAPVTCISGANGDVTFTYADAAGAGDDTIKASFTDTLGSLQTANAQQHWSAATVHTLTTTVAGSGFVASTPDGIDCPETCSAGFTAGTVVELTASPAEGFAFSGWSGACTGTGACSVTMNAAQSVTATFTAIVATNTLGVTVTGAGSVTSDPAGIACPETCSAAFTAGSSVVLTATASEGSVFAGWSGACAGTDPCPLTMSTDQEVTATFDEIPANALSVSETSSPPVVTAGNTVLQTFTVSNTGAAQTNVALSVTLPAGSVVESRTASQGICTVGPPPVTCALGPLPTDSAATVSLVVRVPPGFPPGVFAPEATSSSDQSPTTPAGPLPGSDVVAPAPGQAFGFVPPGGSITTGAANRATPTAATFTLPNTGAGSPISLTTEPTTPTFCGALACRGLLLTLSPFSGGYDNPRRPPVLDISLDRSVVRRFGPAFRVWVQKEDTTVAPVLVPECKSLRKAGKYRWHHRWWKFKKGRRVADPSPCVSRRFIDRKGDSHVEILILEGDPKFGRR